MKTFKIRVDKFRPNSADKWEGAEPDWKESNIFTAVNKTILLANKSNIMDKLEKSDSGPKNSQTKFMTHRSTEKLNKHESRASIVSNALSTNTDTNLNTVKNKLLKNAMASFKEK